MGRGRENTLYTGSVNEQDDPRKWSDDPEPTSHDSDMPVAGGANRQYNEVNPWWCQNGIYLIDWTNIKVGILPHYEPSFAHVRTVYSSLLVDRKYEKDSK